ncbi:hypothetical protein D3C78_1658530 [compost metagenome]
MHKKKSPKRRLMPLLLTLSLAGCASKPVALQPEQVSAPAVPALPREARQPDNLPWCSPTCSAGLTKERVSWQQRMTELERQD